MRKRVPSASSGQCFSRLRPRDSLSNKIECWLSSTILHRGYRARARFNRDIFRIHVKLWSLARIDEIRPSLVYRVNSRKYFLLDASFVLREDHPKKIAAWRSGKIASSIPNNLHYVPLIIPSPPRHYDEILTQLTFLEQWMLHAIKRSIKIYWYKWQLKWKRKRIVLLSLNCC